jgi:uncharacterized protein YPO0396
MTTDEPVGTPALPMVTPLDTEPVATHAQAGDGLDGLRLQRVEVLNWGTFHQRVAVLDVRGGNCLLTGQVGAGKSTVVDAISVVMNPPSQITFNQAAGAARRERNLTSYVLGAYRNLSDETTGMAKPDYLRRAAGTQAVVLTVYGNRSGHRITIGALLRFQNETSSPKVQYLVADKDLSIERDFAGHADARRLRAALKALGVEIFDHYRQYAKVLNRKLRLSGVALGLFNQTVSLKSVSDLNGFVRTHMLEPADVTVAVDKMLSHYADLTRAHDLVVDARRQLDTLDKVAAEADRLDAAERRIISVREAGDAVPCVVDKHRAELLRAAIAADSAALPPLRGDATRLRSQIEAMRRQQTDLEIRLHSHGGTDLTLAERDVKDARTRQEHVVADRRTLEEHALTAGVEPPAGRTDFARFLTTVATAQAHLAQDGQQAQQALAEAVGVLTQARRALQQHDAEMTSAATRSSNIPTRLAELRDTISSNLGFADGTLMFAGELLAVAPEHAQWRGAIERLTRGFATSLLVPDAQHAQVTAWVDRNHLGQRLVTYRVDDRSGSRAATDTDTVASKLVVKPGARATAWVAAEVVRRFDHQCVADPADLPRHARAVTRAGQVKDSNRQEKDDRRRVDDRLNWVLGWDTRDRRDALTAARPALIAAVDGAEKDMKHEQEVVGGLAVRDRALTLLSDRFTDPSAVDVAAAREATRTAEKHLAALQADPQIAELSAGLARVGAELEKLDGEHSGVVGQIATTEQTLDSHRAQLAGLQVVEPQLDEAAMRVLQRAGADAGPPPARLSGVERWERALRDKVEGHATSARLHRSTVEQALVSAIGAYASGWPARVVDVDTSSVQGRVELLALRGKLIADDLPRFEKDFREKLQSNAINEIAMFARKLDTDAEAISERIATINTALDDIDYQPGTRIQLTVEPTKDQQVRDFRAQLKAITTGMVGAGDGAYNEAKFLAVRELLDRFSGREGHADEDARWMRRVTDVRNWHTFAATERSRDEDTLVEHYSDSDGKSGGQKEKLAYTILAASLTYQYGLAEGDAHGFRFVMIDEAFGRGSEESTRYGLDLFGRLGLQLLVVTPLQKITTIEPYVQAVGYIGKSGNTSRLRSLTVEEYRQLRAERLTGGIGAALSVRAEAS